MSHNINIKDGNASMFYHGEVPWHGLGKKLDKPATAEEAIKESQMDFLVEKFPLFTKIKNKEIDIPNEFATIRTDTNTILGTVGKNYTVVQNREVFNFFDPIIDEEEAIYHTAGVLGKGEKIWLLAKLPDYIRIEGTDDIIEKYVLLCTSHNGSMPLLMKFTPVRVVCNNTLTMALQGAEQKVTVRHTPNAEFKIREAHKKLGLINKLAKELEDAYNRMTKVKMSDSETVEFLKKVFPDTDKVTTKTENIRNKCYELIKVGAGMEMKHCKGTLWGAYQGVVEYADHVRTYEDSPIVRADSIWFGRSATIKNNVFNHSLSYMNTKR
jgi:phage/plasmid-like protein (TIGR03299 family)